MIKRWEKKNEEFVNVAGGYNNRIIVEDDKIKEYGLSLNTLVDSYTNNTIMIKYSCQGRNISILIDNGSTHGFIDT
jgi:hypothetical protein